MYTFKQGFRSGKFIFHHNFPNPAKVERFGWLTMEGILIPGLPNDVSLEILARVPRQYYYEAIPRVSSSWKEAVTSPSLFALRKRLQITESWLYTAVVCEYGTRPSILWFARSREGSEWWPLPVMTEEHRPIFGFRCAAVGENLYVLGGCEWKNNCTNFPATNKVSVFNARTNRWSCVQDMTDARANFACRALNGNLLVAGGDRFVDVDDENSDDEKYFIGCNCLKSAEMYNSLTNSWTRLCDMIRAKHFVGGCVIDDKFMVCGFVCEGDLQFCETTEIFEAAENRWVQFHGVEEEMGDGEAESRISLFEMDDDDDDHDDDNPSSSSVRNALKYVSPQLKPYFDDNVVTCSSQLSDVLVRIKKEEDINECEDGCECGRIPQACFVIAI